MHILKTLTPFKPTKLSGCALWLDASRGVTTVDGNVSSWADQSGNGNNAAQSTVDYRPTYVASAQGGKPTLRFDGSGDNLYLSSVNSFPSGASTRTAIVVLKTSDTSRRNDVFGFGNWAVNNAWGLLVEVTSGNLYISHNYNDIRGTSTPTTGYTICSSVLEGANVSSTKLYKNGQSLPVSLVFSDGAVDTLYSVTTGYIGDLQTHTRPFYGDISEIIIFNRALTSYERQTVEKYLSTKYAITTTSGPEGIPDCALWLKADAGITTVDGNVSSWADQSGNGRNVSQSNVGNRFSYISDGMNGKPVLRGHSSAYMMDSSIVWNITPSSGCTVFNVIRTPSSGTGMWAAGAVGTPGTSNSNCALFWGNGGYFYASTWSSDPHSSDTLTNSANYIYAGVFTTGHVKALVNGSQKIDSAITWNSVSNGYYIGNTTGYGYITGDVAEIIIFNRALTDTERYSVELYLSRKYAIALS